MISRAEIKTLLLGILDEVAAMGLPDGRLDGRSEFKGTGPDGSVWSINVGQNAHKRGVFGKWQASGGQRGGDVVHFLTATCFADSYRDMTAWVCRRFGIDGKRLTAEDLQRRRLHFERIEDERRRESEAYDAARREEGRQIYAEGLAGSASDPVRHYLGGRGIDGPAPACLRFGPSVEHELTGQRLPAMLAPVISLADGTVQGVHRTYLAPDINGGWRKAALKTPKLSCGPTRGNVIPLTDGGSGLTWCEALARPASEAHRELLLMGEGIENVLTALPAFPATRSCAYIFAGNIKEVMCRLRRRFDPIILVGDRDKDSGGRDQLRDGREAAIAQCLRDGRGVMLIAPPPAFHDMNDLLCALVERHGYRWGPAGSPPPAWESVLREAKPIRAGDPAAEFYRRITGGRWQTDRKPGVLRLHPALPTIECPGSVLPALVAPVVGLAGVVGAMVAWLAPRGESLAPLLLPVRLLGVPDGVVPIATPARRMPRHAQLVIGLPNALCVAGEWPHEAVFCAIDPSHAIRCVPGVPREVDRVTLWTDNDDVTLAGEYCAAAARDRLMAAGLHVDVRRPWNEYPDIAAMLHAIRDLAP